MNCTLFFLAWLVHMTFFPKLLAISSEIKLCHVSSSLDGVLPSANDLDTRFGGFHEAVQRYNAAAQVSKTTGAHPVKKAEFIHLKPEKDSMDIPSMIERAHRQNCFAVVGLISSKDALLAAPFLRKYKMTAVSSTAVSNDLDDYFPHVLSLSSSAESWAREIVNQVSLLKSRSVVVLYDSSDIYSYSLLGKLKQEWERDKTHNLPALQQVQTSDDNAVNDLANGPDSQHLAIVFATYPMASLPALKLLSHLPRSASSRIFGNPAWMETHAFSANPDLFQRLPEFFLIAPWFLTDENEKFKNFKKSYHLSYKKAPDHDSSYDYDAATVLLECASAKVGALECIAGLKSFSGVTGDYVFTGKAHPERPERAQRANFFKALR